VIFERLAQRTARLPPPLPLETLTAELLRRAAELEDPDLQSRLRFVDEIGRFCSQELGVQCTAHAYGSSASGLCLKGADVDVFIGVDDVKHPDGLSRSGAQKLLARLERALRKQTLESVRLIAEARVPVLQVRITQPRGIWSYNFDINLTDSHGHVAGHVLAYFVSADVRLKQLALPLKELLNRTQLNDAKAGYLCTYGWMICLVAFLQSRTPPVLLHTIDPTNQFSSHNTDTIGALFLAFFEWMATLEWDRVYVSVESPTGAPRPREELRHPQQGRLMVIEDIVKRGENIITSMPVHAFHAIIALCRDVHEVLSQTNDFAHLLSLDLRQYRKRPVEAPTEWLRQ